MNKSSGNESITLDSDSPLPADNGAQKQDSASSISELDALRYENSKLKKINQVLIQRIENGLGNHTGAYASFESAVILSDKVRERTIQLQQALNDLEDVNNDLTVAKREAEDKHHLLIDAIESISDAFVLFDDQHRFTLANTAFYQLWNTAGLCFQPGLSLKEIQQQIAVAGIIDTSIPSTEKIVRRGAFSDQGVFRLKDGRWVQITERHTREGGLVIIFTDITSLKHSEAARRDQALAEKSRVLQSTLDHLSQGVALFNAHHLLEAWNNQLLNLTSTPKSEIYQGISFHKLTALGRLDDAFSDGPATDIQGGTSARSEKVLKDGKLLEVKRHHTSSGGFVITYTDITEREEYETALWASENRIRLITDAMPALIGYISRDLRYTFINQTFEVWFQRSRENIEQLTLDEILGTKEYQRHRRYFQKTLSGQRVDFEVEQTLPCGKRYIHKTYIPDYNEAGKVVGLFALEQDVTQQRRTAEALNHAYQHMEHRVTERTQELTTLNTKLRQEVAERKEAEKQLVDAKREAEHANMTKTKFLAAVSHDLLQPMSAARLFTTALQEHSLPEDSARLVESLNYSMEDVESLVSTLVDISKLDAGVVESDIAPFDVSLLLCNLANEFRPQAAQANLRFRFVPSSAVINTDTQLLARILRNLLANAIRYTEQGDVLFGCRRHPEGLSIQVWDTGIGIPQEKLTEIFLEFKRLPTAKKQSSKGLGLGLAIVDKISRILGSQISVHSNVGKGSMFSILVPYGELPKQQRLTGMQQHNTLQNPLARHHILVIDNDTSICAGMDTLLSSWGCRTTSATSVRDLNIEMLQQDCPDLVIADYHLDNGETGIDAVKELHTSLGQVLPVLMITANRSQDLKQQVRELGYHLLNKPIKPHKLKSMLRYLLV